MYHATKEGHSYMTATLALLHPTASRLKRLYQESVPSQCTLYDPWSSTSKLAAALDSVTSMQKPIKEHKRRLSESWKRNFPQNAFYQ